MKRFLVLALLVFPSLVYGRCINRPEHTFTMSVYECRGATFDAGQMRFRNGTLKDAQSETVSGVVLAGTTSDHEYDWKDWVEHDSYENWASGSYQSVFIDRDPASFCAREESFELTLRVKRRCCDTFPQKGLCLVPLVEVEELRSPMSKLTKRSSPFRQLRWLHRTRAAHAPLN